MKYGFFYRWSGIGASSETIASWIKKRLNNKVCITILSNKFLYVECTSTTLKEKLLAEGLLKFMNIGFHILEWSPFFDPFDPCKVKKKLVEKAIKLNNLPIELSDANSLRAIGNSLGKFVEFIDLDKNYVENIIIVEMDLNDSLNFSLEISCEAGVAHIFPKIIDGDFVEEDGDQECSEINELPTNTMNQTLSKTSLQVLDPIHRNRTLDNENTPLFGELSSSLEEGETKEIFNSSSSPKTIVASREKGKLGTQPTLPSFQDPTLHISFNKDSGGFYLDKNSPQLDKALEILIRNPNYPRNYVTPNL